MKGSHRLHAARVALVATAIVLAAYALCAFALHVFVEHRLNGEVDAQLETRLSHESAAIRNHGFSSVAGHAAPDTDVDDVPVFFWVAGPHAAGRPLSSGAPPLPLRTWSAAPVTLTVESTPFRFVAARVGSNWVVAGENVVGVRRVDSALVLPEVLFGLLVGLATFVGAFVVGLRASAPLELVRRRQAEFTADASHELRTPLSVVEAEVDLALRHRRTSEEYEAVLGRIGGEALRLRRIVDDLLWLARADDRPSEEHDVGHADVGDVAAACVDRFQAIAEQHCLSLTFLRHGSLPAIVQAEVEWIDRLVGVLIDNACKYAGPGGSAAVAVTSSPHRVVLSVDDSGPGIPASERAAVLDRFHRATADEGGSGLGLAIADSVVRLTDGAWSIGDAPLGGARMAVTWRQAASRQETPPREAPARAPDFAASRPTDS